MSFQSEYKLEDVPAARVASDNIDGTFRSTSIGELDIYVILCTYIRASIVGDGVKWQQAINCYP